MSNRSIETECINIFCCLFNCLVKIAKIRAVNKWYENDNFDSLLDSYFTKYQPYHTKHILIKLDDYGVDYQGVPGNTRISESEATRLNNLALSLTRGSTFSDLVTASDDYYSSLSGGDVGIMSTLTSFYNEYKFGVYAFDGVLSGSRNYRDLVDSQIGFRKYINEYETVFTFLDECIDLKYVPIEAFTTMWMVKDDEPFDEEHLGDEFYYPRNIYFNKYLNRRTPFVITNNGFEKDSTVRQSKAGDHVTASDISSFYNYEARNNECGFRYVEGICKDPSQMILTDEQARPILCFRSPVGIHFVVIEKSPFDDNAKDYYKISGYDMNDSYVGFQPSMADYSERKQTILDEISGSLFSPYFNYHVFNYLLNAEEDLSFEFYDKTINYLDEIGAVIDTAMHYNYEDYQTNFFNNGWVQYLQMLDEIEAKRYGDMLIPEPLD